MSEQEFEPKKCTTSLQHAKQPSHSPVWTHTWTCNQSSNWLHC